MNQQNVIKVTYKNIYSNYMHPYFFVNKCVNCNFSFTLIVGKAIENLKNIIYLI